MVEPLRPADPAPAPEPESVRLLRRAEPRLAIALAGAGAALAVLGALTIGGDNTTDGASINRWPGVIASALLVAAGYAALGLARRGPIATAGAVTVAAGIPALMLFLTIDELSPSGNVEAILVVSTAAWLGTWALGPSRHRPLFLGAACAGGLLTALQLVEGLFSDPFTVTTTIGGEDAPFDGGEGFVETGPDWTMVGVICLVFAAVYLVVARTADQRGRARAATPITAIALVALGAGVASLVPDLEAVGTGLLLIMLGAVVSWHGASVGRRLSTWVGAAALAAGVLTVITDAIDGATLGGFVLVMAGVALVLIAYGVASGFDEPDELVPGVSTFAAGQSISSWPDDDEPPSPPPPSLPPHPPTA